MNNNVAKEVRSSRSKNIPNMVPKKASALMDIDIKTRTNLVTKEEFKHIFILNTIDLTAGLCVLNIFLFLLSGFSRNKVNDNLYSVLQGSIYIVSMVCYSTQKFLKIYIFSDSSFILLFAISCITPFVMLELFQRFNSIVFFFLSITLFFTRYHLRILLVLDIFILLTIFIIMVSINHGLLELYMLAFLSSTFFIGVIFYRYLYYYSKTITISVADPKKMLLFFPYIEEYQELSFLKLADVLLDLNNHLNVKWNIFCNNFPNFTEIKTHSDCKNMKFMFNRFANKLTTIKNDVSFKNYPPFYSLKMLYHRKLYLILSAIDRKKKKIMRLHPNSKRINQYFIEAVVKMQNNFCTLTDRKKDVSSSSSSEEDDDDFYLNSHPTNVPKILKDEKDNGIIYTEYPFRKNKIFSEKQPADPNEQPIEDDKENKNEKKNSEDENGKGRKTKKKIVPFILRNFSKSKKQLKKRSKDKKIKIVDVFKFKNLNVLDMIYSKYNDPEGHISSSNSLYNMSNLKVRGFSNGNCMAGELYLNHKIRFEKYRHRQGFHQNSKEWWESPYGDYYGKHTYSKKTSKEKLQKSSNSKKKKKKHMPVHGMVPIDTIHLDYDESSIRSMSQMNSANINQIKKREEETYDNRRLNENSNTRNIFTSLDYHGAVFFKRKNTEEEINKQINKYLENNIKQSNNEKERQDQNTTVTKPNITNLQGKKINTQRRSTHESNFKYNIINSEKDNAAKPTKNITGDLSINKSKSIKTKRSLEINSLNNTTKLGTYTVKLDTSKNRFSKYTSSRNTYKSFNSYYTDVSDSKLETINLSCIHHFLVKKMNMCLKYIEKINFVVQNANFKEGIIPASDVFLSFKDQKTERYYLMWSNVFDLVYHVENIYFHISLIAVFTIFCFFIRITPLHMCKIKYFFLNKTFLLMFLFRYVICSFVLLLIIFPMLRVRSVNPKNTFKIKLSSFLLANSLVFLSIFDYMWTLLLVHKNILSLNKYQLNELISTYARATLLYDAEFVFIIPIYYFLVMNRLKCVWYSYVFFIIVINSLYWSTVGTILSGMKINLTYFILVIMCTIFIIRPFEIVKREMFSRCVLPYLLFLDDVVQFINNEKELKYINFFKRGSVL